MSTPVGPYLRIEQRSTLHDNFYVEYNITASEGLDVYLQELSHASSVKHLRLYVLASTIFVIFILR